MTGTEIVNEIVNQIEHFLNKMKEDAVSAYAAQVAFFIMMSAFPFIMLVLTLVQYLPVTEEMLVAMAQETIPDVLNGYVISLIEEIFAQPSVAIISVTFVAAIWAASKSFLAIIRGCNSVYGIRETRDYIRLRLAASLYTIVFAVIIVVTLAVMVFGNTIVMAVINRFPVLSEMALLIISLRTAVGFGILFVFFLALYVFIPDRKGKVIKEIPGALLTSVGWISFSYIFSFYIDNFANFNTYGSLTAIVFLMLWLYACMYMFFVGGEINVWLQEHREIGKPTHTVSGKKNTTL